MEPEIAVSPGGLETPEWAAHNLRSQVSQLEALLVSQQSLLADCRKRQALFEEAAGERLRVIQQGDQLLQTRAQAIQMLQGEADQLRLRVKELIIELEASAASAAAERQRLRSVCREAGRGMEELASRESALTRELLELRNEGLIHSMIRRLRNIFS